MIPMVRVLSVPTEASVGGASSGGTHNGKEAKKAAKKPEQAGPLGACKSLHNKYTKVGEATSGAAKAPCSTEGEGAAAPRGSPHPHGVPCVSAAPARGPMCRHVAMREQRSCCLCRR